MIVLINYADNAFERKQKINTISAKSFGRVDRVINYSPNDLDEDFRKRNHAILSQRRGGGYWLWKPYIIKKAFDEISENDILFYVDSGLLVIKGLNSLVNKFIETKDDIMLFDFPLVEVQWTQQSVFDELGIHDENALFSRQVIGGIIAVKKTQTSYEFVSEWLRLCERANLLIEEPNVNNSPFFISHREDQSILSVLAKKHGIKTFSDPTDCQINLAQMIDPGRLCSFHNKESLYNIKDVYFLLVRTQSTLKYVIKYYINQLLKKIRVR